MEIVFSKSFERAYKKYIRKFPGDINKLQNIIRQISENYLEHSLGTHKLSGKLSGLLGCTCGFDCRIVFSVETAKNMNKFILLIDIGTHDEVY